jgi:hypothetical protein
MTNSIAYFKKYVDLLDEVYQKASVSSVLDGDASLVRAGTNANEIIIPKISMDGVADYSRASGYVAGNVTFEFETVRFNYDRGRTFTVDAMDNEETAGMAFGKLSSEFLRTKVAPEIDAFRFALYAGLDDISAATPAALTTGDAWLAALSVAKTQMDEDEVPENRILFINPTGYQLIQNVESYKSKSAFESFSQVIKVPKRRFNTAINLRDGTSENEGIGGYQLTGNDINFMIIHKDAILQYSKHKVNKVVAPEENQTSDGWKFFYREYGLADAYENKRAGIYLHAAVSGSYNTSL